MLVTKTRNQKPDEPKPETRIVIFVIFVVRWYCYIPGLLSNSQNSLSTVHLCAALCFEEKNWPPLTFPAQGFRMSSKNHRPLTKMDRISRSDGVWRRPMVQNPSTSSHLATGVVYNRISPKQPKLSWFEVKNPSICKMLQLYWFTTHI